MKRFWMVLLAAAVLALTAMPAAAQPVVPSKSGMVSIVQGTAYLDGQEMKEPLNAQYPYMKENGSLRTAEGRAEVMMNPGVYVRIGENSEIRMITNRFIDTRVELVKGSAVVQYTEVLKDNNFTLVLKKAEIALLKPGDYRFDSDPARIKVFAGHADVKVDGQTVAVTGGKMLNLGGAVASAEKFNIQDTDALDRWSARQGELYARANASAARQVNDQYGTRDPCYGYYSNAVPVGQYPCVGTWRWNPWYNLWTYIPMRGYCDPIWGYCYYNPRDVMGAYYRPPVQWTPSSGGFGGGYSGVPASSGGYSGAAAASSTAMSAPSAGTGSTAAAASSSGSAGHGSAAGGGHGK
ncbi:MAG: FecR domain-containing protein [Acidobacteriia bacterium]|nr:FecR domain-containing protein [Terriglobia bacterium]